MTRNALLGRRAGAVDQVGHRDRGERVALWLSSVLVILLVMLQAPGRIVAETKLDVLLDPFGFLGRSLAAWDPTADLGRVQNQAAGYLFPMGAWTAVGRLLHVPPWLTQRGWIALVVLVGLWGAHRLAGAVGIATPAGRLVAAWAYALAPATMATVAFQSAGQLPYSLAPWVLLPLVRARVGDHPRRVAARSGLAVLVMGGINGAAAFAVLPLVLVWFVTRRAGPARRRLLGWWAAAVVAATLWWLVPLWVSVRYGLRFTAYTEQPSLTTSTESATEILRGTGNWLSYLPVGSDDFWLRGARRLVVDRLAIVASVLVAVGGVLGLARRDHPARRWLVPAVLVGVVVMGAGYTGSGGGPFGSVVQDLLAGPFAPFRNVHKFAAVVRLPLALGLGHLVAVGRRPDRADETTAPGERHSAEASAGRGLPLDQPGHEAAALTVADETTPPARRRRNDADPAGRARASAPAVVAALLILASILPAARQLTAPGSFDGLPAAWRQAATWLDRHADGRRTLVLPAAAFGEYEWGRPLDEPLGSLLDSPWAVRNLIPLGGNGSTRLLDGVDQALLEDHLPPGFLATLQRAGIGHLLVRNDLDRRRTAGPAPDSIRRVLATEPRLRRVVSFGAPSPTGSDGRLGPRPGSVARAEPELDIYAVPAALDRVAAYPATDALVVGGGPEALLDLPPASVDGRAMVLAVDEPTGGLPSPERAATDTARRRDVDFGGVRNRTTYTLTADEPSPATGDAPNDRWPADAPTGLSVARVTGAATLRSDRLSVGSERPEHQPASAFDGLADTAWVPADPTVGHWVEVSFDRPRRVPAVTVRLPARTGLRVGAVRVTTDGGTVDAAVGADGAVRVARPGGRTSRVRVTVASVVGAGRVAPVGLAEIELEGMQIDRPVVTAPTGPGGSAGDADTAHLSRLRRDRFDRFRSSEETMLDRIVPLRAGRYELTGTASAAPGQPLDRALDAVASAPTPDAGLTASASSHWQGLPTFDASSAVDADPTTAWVGGPEATPPHLRLRWGRPATVSGLILTPAAGTDPVPLVSITVDGLTRTEAPDATGRISFPPVRTDRLDLSFPTTEPDGTVPRLVGLADVRVVGLRGSDARGIHRDRDATIALPCGQGPALTVDGRTVATRATATVGQLLDAAPVRWTACGPVDLDAGEHRITAGPRAALAVDTMSVAPTDQPPVPRARPVRIERWQTEHRAVAIAPGPAAILATTENPNDGWEATFGGRTLAPIRVDGWRQGWLVPAGATGTIELQYRPGTTHRLGLGVGAFAVIALAASALLGRRRLDPPSEPEPEPAHRPSRAPLLAGRAPRPNLVLVGAVLVPLVLAGPTVLAVLPLLVAHRRRPRWVPVIAATAAVAAGAIAWAKPDATLLRHVGTLSAPAQILAAICWAALAVSFIPDEATQVANAPATSD